MSEYQRGRNEQMRENREYLKRLFHTEPDNGRKPKRRQTNRAKFNPPETTQHNQVVITRNRAHGHQTVAKSENNYGVHTFIRILSIMRKDLSQKVTTEFIERHSIKIRAWMIFMLLQEDTGRRQGYEDLQSFLDNESATRFFDS